MTSKTESLLAPSDKFVEMFKREPSSPSDLAWINGYALARAERIVAEMGLRDETPAEPDTKRCQHDLQQPRTTVIVASHGKSAICGECLESWVMPGFTQKELSAELEEIANCLADDRGNRCSPAVTTVMRVRDLAQRLAVKTGAES